MRTRLVTLNNNNKKQSNRTVASMSQNNVGKRCSTHTARAIENNHSIQGNRSILKTYSYRYYSIYCFRLSISTAPLLTARVSFLLRKHSRNPSIIESTLSIKMRESRRFFKYLKLLEQLTFKIMLLELSVSRSIKGITQLTTVNAIIYIRSYIIYSRSA